MASHGSCPAGPVLSREVRIKCSRSCLPRTAWCGGADRARLSGHRPGERLHEVLFAADEPTANIGISGIKAAQPVNPALDMLRAWLAALEQGVGRDDREAIYRVLRDAVPGFRKEAV
jgi:FlaA1/EpsC-like NDP-sugar epimerase